MTKIANMIVPYISRLDKRVDHGLSKKASKDVPDNR